MKHAWCILVLLFASTAQGQKKQFRKPPPPPPPIKSKEEAIYARPPHKIPYGQIKKKFPFSEAATVLLISFTVIEEGIDPGIIWNGDTNNMPKPVLKQKLAGTVDTFGHIEVREIKTLSEKDVEHLADMFYNLDCGYGPLIGMACYTPRNAIIFLDKANKVVAELEICFACIGYQLRPKEFHIGDMRRCKYDELRKIFAGTGIHYGIDE